MRCLHCGVERALLKKLAGSENFCSEAHRLAYREEFSRLALDRLLQSQPAVQKKSPNSGSQGNLGDPTSLPDGRGSASLKSAGETACSTHANKRLPMVGQAVSPAKCHSPGAAEPAAQIQGMAAPPPMIGEEKNGNPEPAGFLDDLRCCQSPRARPISQDEPIFRNLQRAMPLFLSVVVNESNLRTLACLNPSKPSITAVSPASVQVAMTPEPPPVLPDVFQESRPWIEPAIRAPGPVAGASVIPTTPKIAHAAAPAVGAKPSIIARPGPVERDSSGNDPDVEAMASSGFKMVSEIVPETSFLKLLPIWAKGLALATMLGGGGFLYLKFAG